METNTPNSGEKPEAPAQKPLRIRLPNRRPSETQTFQRDGIHVTLTVGYKPDGSPGEIFLNADRADSMLDVLMSDAAIITSIALQHGASLQQIAHALKRDKFGIASSPFGAAVDRVSTPVEVAP